MRDPAACAPRASAADVLRDARLVVLGASGYIGHAFAESSAAHGATVSAPPSSQCDLLDAGQVRRAFASLGDGPHTVVCCAVINKPAAGTYEAFLDNIRLIRHLITGCHGAHVTSVIHLSSVDVYGRRPALPITEQTRLEPDGWYALAKAVGEWMLLSSGELRCPVTVLRLPGVYGPGSRDHSLIGRMVRMARHDGVIRYRGDERTLRDYVHLGDLCELLERLIPLRYHGVLNVATGTSRALGDIARTVAQVCGGAELICDGPDEARDFDLQFDPRALRACAPGFTFTELTDGIRSYLSTHA